MRGFPFIIAALFLVIVALFGVITRQMWTRIDDLEAKNSRLEIGNAVMESQLQDLHASCATKEKVDAIDLSEVKIAQDIYEKMAGQADSLASLRRAVLPVLRLDIEGKLKEVSADIDVLKANQQVTNDRLDSIDSKLKSLSSEIGYENMGPALGVGASSIRGRIGDLGKEIEDLRTRTQP